MYVVAQQQQLAEAVRELFARRNLTLNAASQRFGLDRNAVTRMWNGVPASLEFTERFARTFDEDVNTWRVLAGYPAVEPPEWDPDRAFMAGIRALAAEFGFPPTYGLEALPLADATPEEIGTALIAIRKEM